MSAGPAARTRTLMVAQALSLSAMSVDLTVTALASTSIAPTPILGTLPMALLSIGGVAVSGFVSRLAARIGWRTAFALGAVLALGGGLLSWSALAASHFITLCIGTALVGAYQAITGYYRYVAADLTPGHEARSVARVLAAGVVAAILGPVLATASAGALEPLYSGAYLAVAGLAVAALVTVLTLPRDLGRPAPGTGGRRVSLGTLLRRRDFRDGALIALCSCFSMALIMSGAPLVLAHELHVDEAGRMLAMQLHMIGMYGPMLVLPVLAARLRIRLQAAIGHGAALLGLALSLVSFAAIPVAATLGLIGVSWAFGYASGTALLTRSYSRMSGRRRVGEASCSRSPVSPSAGSSRPRSRRCSRGARSCSCVPWLTWRRCSCVRSRRGAGRGRRHRDSPASACACACACAGALAVWLPAPAIGALGALGCAIVVLRRVRAGSTA